MFDLFAVIACSSIILSFIAFSSFTIVKCGLPGKCEIHGLCPTGNCIDCEETLREESKILKMTAKAGLGKDI